MTSIRTSSGVLALLACLAFAVPASAGDQFQMIGSWLQQRGPVVKIPAAPVSGVPANAIVSQTGAAPRTIVLPTTAFKRTAVTGATNVVPVPVPSIPQLATNFSIHAPAATTAPIGTRPGNRVSQSAWTATRAFKTFAWCPGATANPNCASRDSSTGVGGSAPAGSGTGHGIVRYGPGNGGFGGTMQLVINTPLGPGALGRNFGPTQVAHFPISGMGNQILGGQYAQTNTNYLPPAPITQPVSRTSPMGVILVGGPQVGTFGSPTTNLNFGFPWTTGMILASGSNGGGATATVWSLTGTDTRTGIGSGMVTLVSGGVSQRLGTGLTFISADLVTMSFQAPGTVPAMTPTIAAGAALLMLGAGFAFRKRLF